MGDLFGFLNADFLPGAIEVCYQIAVFTILIGILVAVHEFGHFIVAKWCNVGVIKFSLGFGPAIWKKQYGETIYQVSCVPLGGFVRLVGDVPDPLTGAQPTDEEVRGDAEPEDEFKAYPIEVREMINDRSRWFIEKGFWPRTAIVFAGPLFNLLLAFFIYTLTALVYGEGYVDDIPVIGGVGKGSPALEAGIKEDDVVVSVNGNAVSTWTEMSTAIFDSGGNSITFLVKRGEKEFSLNTIPKAGDVEDPLSGKVRSGYFVGVSPKINKRSVPFWYAPVSGITRTWLMTAHTYYGLWKMVTGQVSAKNLAGPIFIFGEATTQAKKGIESFLYFLAVLSVSLAVINLLPIPILDGGHIMFFILESIIGPIGIRNKEIAQEVGLALILCLMVFVIHNDIVNRGKRDSEIKWKSSQSSSSPRLATQ